MRFRRIKEVAIIDLKVGDIWESGDGARLSYWEVTSKDDTPVSDLLKVEWRHRRGYNHIGRSTGTFWLSASRKRWIVAEEPTREANHYPCLDSDCDCIWDNF